MANKKVVQQFNDKRIKCYWVEPRAVKYVSWRGVQHARNIGCRFASGNYIAMLDDDDIWKNDKIEIQLKEMTKVGAALAVTYVKTIDKSNCIVDKANIHPIYKNLLQSFNFSSTSSYMLNKNVLERVGWWNEDLRGMHEYDIALKIARRGYRIITIQKPLTIRTRIANQERSYYYIKIAEVFELWQNYGKDFIQVIGSTGFIFNTIKTIGLISLFTLGFIIKEKICNIIYPIKSKIEQHGVMT